MKWRLYWSIGLCFFLFTNISVTNAVPDPSAVWGNLQHRWYRIELIGKKLDRASSVSESEILKERRMEVYREAKRLYEVVRVNSTLKPVMDLSKKGVFFLQKYKLSCEIAALSMILRSAWYGDYSEDLIISDLPFFPGPLSDEGVWGDPDHAFVGDIHGSQYRRTGYGVHEAPLSAWLTRQHIRHTTANRLDGRNLTPRARLTEHLESLENGARVMFWGDWCTDAWAEDGLTEYVDAFIIRMFRISGKNMCPRSAESRQFSWTTPDGVRIDTISWEHAFVLLGYIGEKKNPTHIIVWDTNTGRHVYPTTEWIRKWNLLQNRSITVYPN